MKLEKTVIAVSLLSICLLAPSARAATVAITPVSSPLNAGTTSGGGTKNVGQAVSLTARADAGAVFEDWTIGTNVVSTNEIYKFNAGTNNETVVANFDWVVTTKASPANAGMTFGGADYTNGANLQLEAEPTNNWYKFVKWTKKDGSLFSTNAFLLLTATNGEALTADFALKEVTVTTVSYPASAGKTSGGGTKTPGQIFELRATPDAGAVFINWTIGTNIAHTTNVASTNNPYRYTNGITNVTLFANFGLGVTTKSSPVAGGTTKGAGEYTNNQSVTITATPNTNGWYYFTDWTQKDGKAFGTNSASATNTFVITNADALTANFKLKEETVTTASYPTNGGKTTGKGTYASGTKVFLTATADAGYKFVQWTSNGFQVSTNANYHFTATVPAGMTNSTNAFMANFKDVSVPTLAITSPAHGEKVGASLLEITGTANNILKVSDVVVTLGGTPVTVMTTNQWTNWWAGVLLAPGDNEISAYAVSEAGTNSAAKTVKVTDTNSGLAPVSLAGLMARASNNVEGTNWFSFGAATMEQFGVTPDLGSGAGNYTYTQTGPSNAILVTSHFTPPNLQTKPVATNFLTFTSQTTANTTNAGATNSGTITFWPLPDYDVSSPSGFTVTAVSGIKTNTTAFADARFTRINSDGTTNTGTYTSVQYGPFATMIVEINAEAGAVVETNYIFNLFTTVSGGSWFLTSYTNGSSSPRVFDAGTFTAAKSPTGEKYVAPETLNGMSVEVSPASSGKFAISVGQATLGQTGKTTNDNDTLVANYLYTRNGPTNAYLYIYDLLPSTNVTALSLTFEHSGKAAWSSGSGTNVFSGTSTFSVLPQADYFAPAAMDAGKIILGAGASKVTMSLNDGGFTNLATPRFGNYTYTPFSPTVGMIVQTDKDTNSPGVSYLQLTFTSASAGTYFSTPAAGSVKMGSFTFTK